jgi:hypothetical protein
VGGRRKQRAKAISKGTGRQRLRVRPLPGASRALFRAVRGSGKLRLLLPFACLLSRPQVGMPARNQRPSLWERQASMCSGRFAGREGRRTMGLRTMARMRGASGAPSSSTSGRMFTRRSSLREASTVPACPWQGLADVRQARRGGSPARRSGCCQAMSFPWRGRESWEADAVGRCEVQFLAVFSTLPAGRLSRAWDRIECKKWNLDLSCRI